MSTSLHVGYLDEMRRCDEEGEARFRQRGETFRALLRENNLPDYSEPAFLNGGGYNCQILPGNGIAFLQRFACYFGDGADEWPEPGDPKTMSNPLTDRRVEEAAYDIGVHPFQHLVHHSPRDGYWLPVDFANVLFPDRALNLGNMVGSTPRLLRECEKLAGLLELPTDKSPHDPDVLRALDVGDERTVSWQAYGIEAYDCLALIQACRKSVELGAAIVLR